MSRIMVELLIVIVAIAMTVIGLGFMYGWFGSLMGGHADFMISEVQLYYDPDSGNSWGFFKLTNTGSVDIVGITVYIVKYPNGTMPANPVEVSLDSNTVPTSSTPLKKGDYIQVKITSLPGVSEVGSITLRFRVEFSGAKPIEREETYRIVSP